MGAPYIYSQYVGGNDDFIIVAALFFELLLLAIYLASLQLLSRYHFLGLIWVNWG